MPLPLALATGLIVAVFLFLFVSAGLLRIKIKFPASSHLRSLHRLHAAWTSSSSSSIACSTPECQSRLLDLQEKLALEESIYQAQVKAEIRRSRRMARLDRNKAVVITKQQILQERYKEMNVHDFRPEYRPRPDLWNADAIGGSGSFPELNVAGNLKTGTSQLYNILQSHRDVATIPDDYKEHCADDEYDTETPEQDLYEYAMFQWHNFYYTRKERIRAEQQQHRQQQEKKIMVVNGCLVEHDLELRYAYHPPAPHQMAKFFVLLRDPADWSWAAYNFWCDASWEHYSHHNNWVNETIHYRSPEVFHEVVLSGGKMPGADRILGLRNRSITDLRRLKALVGMENLIVLKNEDMQPHKILMEYDNHKQQQQQQHKVSVPTATASGQSGNFLQVLSRRTGLSVDGFDRTVLEAKSNCNANKGFENKCREGEEGRHDTRHLTTGYPVTQNRPMLESTRKFLYVQWHYACKVWAEEFNVVYPDCLAAVPEATNEEEEEENEENEVQEEEYDYDDDKSSNSEEED